MSKRKVIDARKNKDGIIQSVLLEGNKNFISVDKAYDMAKAGDVDLVAVGTGKGKYVRTPPDKSEVNNLSTLADD